MLEDEKNQFEPIFTEGSSVVYNMEALEHFGTENYTWRLDIV